MAMTSRNGVEIYYEAAGNGPVLVMLHGTFGSSADWQEYGYVSAFHDRFRIITMDFRGHGRSGKPLDPAVHRTCEYAEDVRQVLKTLNMKEFHLIGFSRGGRVGFYLSTMADIRMLSFVSIGMHPFFLDMGSMLEAVNGIDTWSRESGISTDHQERLVANDRAALRAAATLDLPEERIDKITMPTLFVAGQKDEDYEKIIKVASLIPTAQLLTLPGLDHFQSLTKSDQVLPRVETFLDEQLRE
jgi:pimeloyl-ACP methyl ester carboxylesterase